MEKMISCIEVCEWTKLSERTIRQLVAKNQIPHRKLGVGKKPPIRFVPSEIRAWIDRQGAVMKIDEAA